MPAPTIVPRPALPTKRRTYIPTSRTNQGLKESTVTDTKSPATPATSAPHEGLPASLHYIVEHLQDLRDLRPCQVRRIVMDANVQPTDLAPWGDFDHPVGDSYGRQLVYRGDHFEIMVMSWRPGDYSAIHDHGHTQWGAVQIFGPAEHATFRLEDGYISTLARWTVEVRDVVGVGHSLIHQMGNATKDTFFLTLHVYGTREDLDSITGDARIFDLENGSVQRVDGGVFYALPAAEVKSVEHGIAGDFPTRFRHMVELVRRLRRMDNRGVNNSGKELAAVIADTYSAQQHAQLLRCLETHTDGSDHQINSVYWRALGREVQEAAALQNELKGELRAADDFHKYADMYDKLIGKRCLDGFMAQYLRFFNAEYPVDLTGSSLISLGTGTALVEEFMIKELGIPYEQLYGIDISEAMVNVARRRIQADVGDVLQLDPSIRLWDIAFSGLNVFHYLDHERLEEAVQKTASIVRPGGWFIGDFITPDHIRWYPNVMYSEDRKIISLRTPKLIEHQGRVFQESEIINLNFEGETMEINYAGKHRRFLPPMHRIRMYFERAFGGQVDLYDAYSLDFIEDWADSCPSTRYVVIARKAL